MTSGPPEDVASPRSEQSCLYKIRVTLIRGSVDLRVVPIIIRVRIQLSPVPSDLDRKTEQKFIQTRRAWPAKSNANWPRGSNSGKLHRNTKQKGIRIVDILICKHTRVMQHLENVCCCSDPLWNLPKRKCTPASFKFDNENGTTSRKRHQHLPKAKLGCWVGLVKLSTAQQMRNCHMWLMQTFENCFCLLHNSETLVAESNRDWA